MQVTFEIPDDIGEKLLRTIPDLNRHAKECYGLDKFREGVVDRADLGMLFDFDEAGTDAFLQRCGVVKSKPSTE